MMPPNEGSWIEAEPIWTVDSEESMVWRDTMDQILYNGKKSILSTLSQETKILVKEKHSQKGWVKAYKSLLKGRSIAVSPIRTITLDEEYGTLTVINHYNQV